MMNIKDKMTKLYEEKPGLVGYFTGAVLMTGYYSIVLYHVLKKRDKELDRVNTQRYCNGFEAGYNLRGFEVGSKEMEIRDLKEEISELKKEKES